MEAEPGLLVVVRRHRRRPARSGRGSCRRATRGRRRGPCRGRRRRSTTASASSIVQPPAKTPSRRKSRRSVVGQQVVAPGDRARAASAAAPAGRARPPARSRLRPSRSRICAGLSVRTRAAASSIASGRPPSRSQIARTAARGLVAEDAGPAGGSAPAPRTARRPPTRRAAGPGWPCSPPIRSSSRLVTRTRSSGDGRGRATRPCPRPPAGAARGCRGPGASIWSRSRARSASADRLLGGLADADRRRDRRSRRGPGRGAPRGRRTRSRAGSDRATARAAPSARRVLPLPPGPVRVTIRLVRERLADERDLRLAADERRHVAGQVRRRVERPQPPAVVGGARDDEPMEPGRLLEVLDGAEALVDQLDAGETGCLGQVAPERGRERVGEDDLAAVRGRGDPGRVVDRDPDVVLRLALPDALAQSPLAQMQAHPDPEHVERPGSARDPALAVDGGRGAVERVARTRRRTRRPRS